MQTKYIFISDLPYPNYSTMDMNRVSESDLGMLDDGWMNQQTSQKLQEAKAKPHAQAHLLSPTDKCKVDYELDFANYVFINNIVGAINS